MRKKLAFWFYNLMFSWVHRNDDHVRVWQKGEKCSGCSHCSVTGQEEEIWKSLAWLLPDQLVYWCTIRLIAFATQGEFGGADMPEITAMDALQRWEKKDSEDQS